jgi:thiamine kinase-like enzyme
MNIDNAAKIEDDEGEVQMCNDCEEAPYVLFEGERLCRECGYVAGSGGRPTRRLTNDEAWTEWHEHRRNEDDYDGWYGEKRIKMVGGFAAAYDYGAAVKEGALLAD